MTPKFWALEKRGGVFYCYKKKVIRRQELDANGLRPMFHVDTTTYLLAGTRWPKG